MRSSLILWRQMLSWPTSTTPLRSRTSALASNGGDSGLERWKVSRPGGVKIAMLLHEAMGSSFRERVKIYATDIDEDALNHARPPSYTERETRGQPESYRAGLRITGSPRVGLAGQQFPATPGYHP